MRSPRATPDRVLTAVAVVVCTAAIALGAAPSAGPGPTGASRNPSRILVPVAGLIVVAVLGGLGVMAVRRRMLAKDTAAADQGGLLEDLRRLRDTGQISPAEFDAARKSIAARLRGELAEKSVPAGQARAGNQPAPGRSERRPGG